MREKGFTVEPFPSTRTLIIESGTLAKRKHTISGLLEFDVTQVRAHIAAHRAATGETLSFTAYLIAALGQAVAAHPVVHSYRNLRGQLITFDDVDILTYIEIDLNGAKFPLGYILRGANRKSWRELHDELRAAQANPDKTPNAGHLASVQWFVRLPGFVRRLAFRLINRMPHQWKLMTGTVFLTSVGMFGGGGGSSTVSANESGSGVTSSRSSTSGWGLGFSAHTLGVTVGGISQQPRVVNGAITIREVLNVTVDFDHDVVDGAPAARFVAEFKRLVEGGMLSGDGGP
jgi:pyruvate/2-oxoglutarate dehydrogenase complex dihydrolipoamide acyltransferase (E2) component